MFKKGRKFMWAGPEVEQGPRCPEDCVPCTDYGVAGTQLLCLLAEFLSRQGSSVSAASSSVRPPEKPSPTADAASGNSLPSSYVLCRCLLLLVMTLDDLLSSPHRPEGGAERLGCVVSHLH